MWEGTMLAMGHYVVLSSLCSRLEFELKVCSEISHGKDWQEHESKDCYDIWLIQEGHAKVEMEGETYLLSPGDAFLFYPQVMYMACADNGGCSFVFVRFDVSLGKNLRPLDSFPLSGQALASDIAQETSSFLESYSKFKEGQSMAALALKGALMILTSRIAAVKAMGHEDSRAPVSKSPYYKLEQLLSFVTKNIHQPLSVKTLAEQACMSEKYFISFFKDTTGITPHVYITGLKLKRAFEYLSEGKYSVKETAQMLGYSDQYTFSKAFKRHYGFSPSQVSTVGGRGQ